MRGLACRSVDHQFIKVLYYLAITYISCLFFETFLVIGPLHRPRKQAGYFDRSILADKHVFGTNIAYFFVLAVEEVSC